MTSPSTPNHRLQPRHDSSRNAVLGERSYELSVRPANLCTKLGQNRFDSGNLMHNVASRLHGSISTARAQRRRGHFDFFSLPPEIRNEIMRLVLVPGDVHLRGPKKHGVKAKIHHAWDAVHQLPRDCHKIPAAPSLPGFQMLATCKSVYGQYHETFYSSNTFFFAPGLFKETIKYYTISLQPEHVNMISSIGVNLGLEDLTPIVFKKAQECMSLNRGCLSSYSVGQKWGIVVKLHLLQIWQRKLEFLGGVQGLKMVKLATKGEVVEIDGADLKEALNGISTDGRDPKNCAEEVAALIERAQTSVQEEITERVDRDGWRALRAWVHGGGFQNRL